MTCHLDARRRDGVLRFRVWNTVSDTYDWAGDHPEGMLGSEAAPYMAHRWAAEGVARRIAALTDGRGEFGPVDLDSPWGAEVCGTCLDWHRRDDGTCVGWRD